MAASLTDKFRKGAGFFQTTLSGSMSDSDTTFTLTSAAGLPTDTAIGDIVIDRIDQNGELLDPSLREVITGTLSGTTVTTDASRRGLDNTTAQAHTAGAVVEVNFTADTWNDHIDGILASLNQDGTIKDDAVDTAQIADSAVTTAQIADDAVGTDQIADGAVTAAKLGTMVTTSSLNVNLNDSSITSTNYSLIYGSATSLAIYKIDGVINISALSIPANAVILQVHCWINAAGNTTHESYAPLAVTSVSNTSVVFKGQVAGDGSGTNNFINQTNSKLQLFVRYIA